MRIQHVVVELRLLNKATMKRLLSLLILFINGVQLNAQLTTINQPIINAYAAVTEVDFCTNAMDVANNAENNFSVGEKVLIVQMKRAQLDPQQNANFGNVLDYDAAGSYEYNFVKSINFGNIDGIQFENTLLHSYNTLGKIQIICVPEYVDVEFQATLTAIPWDGELGGIIVFEASGNVDLQANIFLDEIGFRGGLYSNDNSCYTALGGYQGYSCPDADECGAYKGEGLGLDYDAQLRGRGRNAMGGGGGNDHNAGGGGGANGGAGGRGGDNDLNTQFCDGQGGFGGEKNSLGTSNNRILMGGGGGAGDSNNNSGTLGGNAGGTLIINANSISSNGFQINANGQVADLATVDGAGGGGAGGTVILNVNTYQDVLIVNLNGGDGGDNSDNTNCPGVGGGGGGGTIWIQQPSSLPVTITLNANGGLKGDYTSNLCNGLSLFAEDGEDGVFAFNYTPVVSSVEFIATELSAGTGAIICAGEETPLTSTVVSSENPAFSWVYQGNDISTQNDLAVSPLTQGVNEYIATAQWEVFGQLCKEEETVSIIVKNPDITIVVSPTVAVEVGEPVFLNAVVSPASLNYTYRWDPDYVNPNDERNAVVEPLESGDFCITITDEIGCEKTECVFITVLLPFTGAPDAFSPNGDNVNDVFKVLPEPQLVQTSLKIFNRWGDKLYESGSIFEWNGMLNGVSQNSDVYIWVADFEHRNTGEKSTQDGYLTLIK
jgi:gliding motility-associated-like protein